MGVVSHREREVAEPGAERELAVEYLKAAMAPLDDPEDLRFSRTWQSPLSRENSAPRWKASGCDEGIELDVA